jgi:hypothetical protein
MLRPRNIYFGGTALLALAAINEGSITGALILAGGAFIAYGFAVALAEYDI